MSFLRPQALATLERWREVGIALAVALFGLWLALRGGYVFLILGGALSLLALGLAFAAWRRARFARGIDAPGLVEVDEGRVSYLGPVMGGSVALTELTEIQVMEVASRRHWRLKQADSQAILIPQQAAGAEALFDIFTALPGARPHDFLAALDGPADPPRTLWRRAEVHRAASLPKT